MNQAKILNLLGLAQRARQLVSGDFIVEATLKKHKGYLLLLASDCAANNRDKYKQLTNIYKIPLIEVATKAQLGQALGKEQRVVVLLLDKGFSQAIQKEMLS
ncbi:MAG: ribosomal L7Ae/L30e/S12e/Gadd45 family protein [Veillonellaceae bacterium]|nr:ribosomal L7Ae/L30e/S12e/Gadd45 family protein [Veillonellaceae bacterium]